MISTQDMLRIKLLGELLLDYQNGKEHFGDLPSKICSLTQMMETAPKELIEKIIQGLGTIKLVKAEACADKIEVLSGNYKDIFDAAVEKMRRHINMNEIKKKYKCEEEDPYAWPYSDDVW